MRSLACLRSWLHPPQLLHVHALSVQRLPEAPVRVKRGGIRFGVTKPGLADRDVPGRFIRPRAQLLRKRCQPNQPNRSPSATSPNVIAAGLTKSAFMV
jgi:hypothetical protein